MTQWIRWWGLAVFAVISLLWILCIDSVIKMTIESAGSRALGARVELDAASFSLVDTELSLIGLKVSNPEQAMQNLIESEQIILQLDGPQLLMRQLIADQVSVHGLQFNTPRQTSGALSGTTATGDDSATAQQADSSFSIPGISLPDTDQLIAAEKAHWQQQFDDSSARLKAMEAGWQQRIDELPNDEQLDDYKARWKAAKKKSWVEKLSLINELKTDMQDDYDNISSMDQQLDSDIAKVNAELARAKKLPQTEAKRMLAKVGLDSGQQDFLFALLGGKFDSEVQQAVALLKKAEQLRGEPAAEQVRPARGEGQWIHFGRQQLPDALIKQADIDGSLKLAGKTINFTGVARDLTHQPDRWSQPATAELSGSDVDGAKFELDALLDLRQAMDAKLNYSLQNFKLADIGLSDSEQMSLKLQRASADLKGSASLSDSALKLLANGNFYDVAIDAIDKADSSSARAIAEVLAGVKKFAINLSAEGDPASPKLKIKSDLDKLLGGALKQQIKAQANKLQGKLSKQLSAEMAPQLAQLSEQSDFLKDLKAQLAEKQKALKGTGKGLL